MPTSKTAKAITNKKIKVETFYLKFQITVSSSTGSNRDGYLDDIVITYEDLHPSAPTFSPIAGTVTIGTEVTISGQTGTTIYYTTDGETPTTSSASGEEGAASATVTIDEAMTVKAIAVKDDLSSSVASASYTLASIATPTFSPAEEEVFYGTLVSISCVTEGTTIHYTTDGSTPTSSSCTYDGPIEVTENQTIKAIAVKDGFDDSEVGSATYTLKAPTNPSFSVNAGKVTIGTSLTLSSTTGATIYYTTDGTTPTASSIVYSEAVILDDPCTIKAIAIDAAGNESDVVSKTYTINGINLVRTGALTFDTFNGDVLGSSSYKTDKDCSLIASDGNTYTWNEKYGYYNGGGWQIKAASDGLVTSPLIKSTFGFTVSVKTITGTATISDGTDSRNKSLTTTKTFTNVTFSNSSFFVIQKITITPINRNALSLSSTSGSTQYGTDVLLTATVADGYDGTLTSSVTNANIAEVAISGTDITITPLAVGSATITITCPETANFMDEIVATYELTVTAPTGSTTADVGALDDIKASVPSSGIGSYCCEYPLTFDDAGDADVKAYAVSSFDEDAGEVTLTRITGAVAGGTPFLLRGEASTEVTLTPVASASAYAGTNLLRGTLAPTYVTTVTGDNTLFGLLAGSFNIINTGVLPPHKAYLPLPTAALSAEVKRFTLHFDDAKEETGIMYNGQYIMDNGAGAVYDMSGRRIAMPAVSSAPSALSKGVYIINGRKKIIK